MVGWLEASNIEESYVCDERAELLRFAHDQTRARVYLSSAASSAGARVETAEKPEEKKSLGAVGLEPQQKLCSRRVRSAESGVEGKSLCERLVWVLSLIHI